MHLTVWPIDGTIAHPTKEPHQFSLIVSTCCKSVTDNVWSLHACVYMHMCVHLWASSHQNKGSCRNTIAKVFWFLGMWLLLVCRFYQHHQVVHQIAETIFPSKMETRMGKNYMLLELFIKKKIPLAAWISKFSDRTFISMLENCCFTAEFQSLVNCQRFTFNVCAFVKKHKYIKELNWFK